MHPLEDRGTQHQRGSLQEPLDLALSFAGRVLMSLPEMTLFTTGISVLFLSAPNAF